jgi:succinoglycan biosynthesis transport protein ExoP
VDVTGPRAHETSFLRDILFIVFKRKIPLVAMFLIGIMIVTYGMRTAIPEYEAKARVLVKRTRQAHDMPIESSAVLKRSEVVNTELQIIRSAAVAELVVDRLGLAEGVDRGIAIARIEGGIQARALPESDIIDITYRSTNAERAARIVNTALEAYLEIRKGVELSTEALAYLEEQAASARAMRDSVAAEMAALGARSGMHELGMLGRQQMEVNARYTDLLVRVRNDIDTRERQLEVIQEWLESGSSARGISESAVYENDGIRRAHGALADLNLLLAGARSRYTDDHPEVERLERHIAATESVLVAEITAAISNERLRLEELRAEEESLVTLLDDLDIANAEVAAAELQMKLLHHDMLLQVDLHDVVMSRMEQFRITMATDPDLLNVAVISRASVPVRPTPRPVNMRVVVGMFMIVFGILMVFALEKMDQSLQSREDAQRQLGVKVLASIPDRQFHRGRR